MPNIKSILYFTVLVPIPLYFWIKLYKAYKTLKKEYEEEKLFYERHNCVVMYASNKGMSGWPPSTERIQFDIRNTNSLLEPFLYFIETSKISLDIAVMVMRSPILFQAIEQANCRGVKIRIIFNFIESQDIIAACRNLIKKGIQVIFYVSQTMNLNSIMHYKYMLKDYNKNYGFLCMGSMNFSNQSAINNYEDVIFTSNPYSVEAFHENFEFSWKLIQDDNESVFNKSILKEFNLL